MFNMDPRQLPSSQSTRARLQSRRPTDPQNLTGNASLSLNALPRFHPATYNSTSSSTTSTPGTNGTSPQPPMSSRSYQHQLSEAQIQLMNYQRELLSHAARGQSNRMLKPVSPKLVPLAGGPGTVTPLELEGQREAEGYMTAGAAGSQHGVVDVEKLIRDECQRRGEMHPQRRQASYSSA